MPVSLFIKWWCWFQWFPKYSSVMRFCDSVARFLLYIFHSSCEVQCLNRKFTKCVLKLEYQYLSLCISFQLQLWQIATKLVLTTGIYYLAVLWVRRLTGLLRLKSKCHFSAFFSVGSGYGLFPWLLYILEATCILWLVALFLSSLFRLWKASWILLTSHHSHLFQSHISFWVSSASLFCILRTHGYSEPTKII